MNARRLDPENAEAFGRIYADMMSRACGADPYVATVMFARTAAVLEPITSAGRIGCLGRDVRSSLYFSGLL